MNNISIHNLPLHAKYQHLLENAIQSSSMKIVDYEPSDITYAKSLYVAEYSHSFDSDYPQGN